MRRFLLFCICCVGATACFGQFTSRLGRFQVDQVKGCAPFTVNITDTNLMSSGECTPGRPCLMDYEGNGTRSTNSFSFVYNTPGTYKLSVTYQSIGTDDITITVVENKDPTFEVYTCVGPHVTIKVTDKSYDSYLIDFNNDGTIDDTIASGNNATSKFDYPLPAAAGYTISVRGKNVGAANNCKVLTESYQIVSTLPQPTLTTLTALDANSLKLDMTTAPHIQYKLEIATNNATTFQVYQNIYQLSTITIPSLLVDANYYCFRLNAFDPCAGTSKYSNTICSQDFDVAFNNGSNDLTWKTSQAGISSVSVARNNQPYTTIPGAPLNYQDPDYDCNQQYCYQITANYGGGKSVSLIKCGVGIFKTTYPRIENLTSVVRAGAELSYKTDPTIKVLAYDIMKSVGGQPFVQHAQTKAQVYTDETYDYKGGTCYQVNYGDACNNRSEPGIIACPLSLSGTMDDKNAITLVWNAYTGYNLGVKNYVVSKYTKNGSLLGEYPTTDTTFTDYDPADNEQVVIYKITAISVEPGIDKGSISNNITFEKPVRLILPTAFTPNGDGINPQFTISGKFVSKMKIQIFDRWGVLVFASDKNEPWDGTRSGRPMPESAYVWKAEVEDFAGNTFTQEGTVLLLRPPR